MASAGTGAACLPTSVSSTAVRITPSPSPPSQAGRASDEQAGLAQFLPQARVVPVPAWRVAGPGPGASGDAAAVQHLGGEAGDRLLGLARG